MGSIWVRRRCAGSAALLALAAFLAAWLAILPQPPEVVHADPPWGGSARINDDGAVSPYPDQDLASDGSGNAYAVWIDWRLGERDVFFSRWDRQSGRWSPNERISDDAGPAEQWSPRIASDAAGNAYAVWRDKRNGVWDLYSSRREASTGRWSPNVKVNSLNMEAPFYAAWSAPSVAVDSQRQAYVAWVGSTGQGSPYYLNLSSWDSSRGYWLPGETITGTRAIIDLGQVAADGQGNVYVPWGCEVDYGSYICLSRRDAATGQWALYWLEGKGYPPWPELGLDALGNAYLLWQSVGARGINLGLFLARWDASIRGFGPVEKLEVEVGVVRGGRKSFYMTPSGKMFVLLGKWSWASWQYSSHLYLASRESAGGPWTTSSLDDLVGVTQGSSPSLLGGDGEGALHLLWQSRQSGSLELYWARQAPSSGQWGTSLKVNDGLGRGNAYHFSPRLAAGAGGSLYAIWEDGRLGYDINKNIYFAYRPAAGPWGPNQRVDDDPGTGDKAWPAMAVDGAGNAYVVWVDRRSGLDALYFAFRAASSGAWSPNERVDTGPTSPDWILRPSIAVDGQGNAYAAWQVHKGSYGDIYFSERLAGTGVWGPAIRINSEPSRRLANIPSIAADAAGNLYVAWSESRLGSNEFDTYFAHRDRATGQWSPTTLISDGSPGGWPRVGVDSQGNAYVTWSDTQRGYLRRRDVGTGQWGPIEALPFPGMPTVVVDGAGHLYALWQDRRGWPYPPDIYFAFRDRRLGAWSYPMKVNDYTGQYGISVSFDLAADAAQNVYAVWDYFSDILFAGLSAPDLPPRYRLFLPYVAN